MRFQVFVYDLLRVCYLAVPAWLALELITRLFRWFRQRRNRRKMLDRAALRERAWYRNPV